MRPAVAGAELEALKSALGSTEMTPYLRDFIQRHVDAIRAALRVYGVHGARLLRDALQKVAGAYTVEGSRVEAEFAAAPEAARDLFAKARNVIKKSADVCDSLEKVGKAGEKALTLAGAVGPLVMPYLQKLVTQSHHFTAVARSSPRCARADRSRAGRRRRLQAGMAFAQQPDVLASIDNVETPCRQLREHVAPWFAGYTGSKWRSFRCDVKAGKATKRPRHQLRRRCASLTFPASILYVYSPSALPLQNGPYRTSTAASGREGTAQRGSASRG